MDHVKRNTLHAARCGSQPGMGESSSGVFLFQAKPRASSVTAELDEPPGSSSRSLLGGGPGSSPIPHPNSKSLGSRHQGPPPVWRIPSRLLKKLVSNARAPGCNATTTHPSPSLLGASPTQRQCRTMQLRRPVRKWSRLFPGRAPQTALKTPSFRKGRRRSWICGPGPAVRDRMEHRHAVGICMSYPRNGCTADFPRHAAGVMSSPIPSPIAAA